MLNVNIGSGNHSCRFQPAFGGEYRISWEVEGRGASGLRFPRRVIKQTDEKGAKRFCAKHGLVMPVKK